jgi:copper resistance protein C
VGKSVTRMTKVLLAVMVGALYAVFSGAPAYAHNSLTGSTPATGATVTDPPETITLRFLARVDPARLTVVVTGPGGVDAGDGKPAVQGSRVTVPWTPGPAGEYRVAYQVGSSDGHPVKGAVRFTLRTGAPAPSPSVSPSTSSSPSVAAPVPTSAGPTTGAKVPTASEQGEAPVWPWVVGGVVLVAAAATGTAILRRRRATP